MKARVPKGPSMQDLMRQAQQMQDDMESKKEELANKEYTVKTGGGAVTIIMGGDKEVKSLEISPDIVDPDDIETLSDILIAGFNEAIKQVEADADSEMEKITGALNMPNIPGMPGGLF